MSSGTSNGGVQVLKLNGAGSRLPLVDGVGTARAVVWPGMGATERSIAYFELEAGASTVWLNHPTEAVYYIMAGSGTVHGADAAESWPLEEGAMVHIGPDSHYRFEAGTPGLTLFGGPCPVDPSMFAGLAG